MLQGQVEAQEDHPDLFPLVEVVVVEEHLIYQVEGEGEEGHQCLNVHQVVGVEEEEEEEHHR